MKLEDAYFNLLAKLALIYDEREAENIVKDYFLDQFKKSNPQINYELTSDEQDQLIHDTSLLMKGVPLQQITGKAFFYDLELKVSKAVLIPRPETEELVSWILEENEASDEITLLDIGTGSGCIPLTLKKHRASWSVYGSDVSEEALKVAHENAQNLSLDVQFLFHNILLDIEESWKQFDILVCNPPYILKEEEHRMYPGTVEHEPHLALFIESDDALLFYKKVIQLSKSHLKPNGPLYFEVSEFHGEEVSDLMKENGFKNVEMRKDLQGKNRMVRGIKK